MGPLVVTSQKKTLNCDISSLRNDTELVGYSMNPELSEAYFLFILLFLFYFIEGRKKKKKMKVNSTITLTLNSYAY